MMDAPFSFDDNPIATSFTCVQEQRSSGFTKYRLKAAAATVDIALMDVPAEQTGSYIDDRRRDLQDMEIRVPSPYTAEISGNEQDPEHPLEFYEEDDRIYGVGFAGPEYRPLMASAAQIPRYRYLVTWRYFSEYSKLAEIEVFIPKDMFAQDAVLALVDSLALTGSDEQ